MREKNALLLQEEVLTITIPDKIENFSHLVDEWSVVSFRIVLVRFFYAKYNYPGSEFFFFPEYLQTFNFGIIVLGR